MVDRIDLSGKWKLALDEKCFGNPIFDYDISMPNTTSNAKKGKYNNKSEEGTLTDTYFFEGWAWFSKDVDFNSIKGEYIHLFLERTRVTSLYIDNKFIGSQESLCTPHIYNLSQYKGTGVHNVMIRVSNVDYKTKGGHLTSPDTQTNWNGITGKMELRGYGKSYCENLMIETDIYDKSCHIIGDVIGCSSGKVKIHAESFNCKLNHIVPLQEFEFSNGKVDIIYKFGDNCLLWSEHEPNLYKIYIEINGDFSKHIVGLRKFFYKGRKFTINDKNTFLRGKHDGMIFPKTGYAPCTVDEWMRVMGISKKFGINHYRFHTCCPPEAAFIAADMLGIYMEPQIPFWGTIYSENEDEYNKEEMDFLVSEGFNMLKNFGNHPSYCMMSLGNELWGSKEKLNEILGKFKAFDGRHLYTQGSNNFQWYPNVVENDDFFVGVRLSKNRLLRGSYATCDAPLGHIQTDPPGSYFNYDDAVIPSKTISNMGISTSETIKIQYGTTMKEVKASENDDDFIPNIPIITHEIGQYEIYPNFKEIEKYTGSLKARNFEIFRDRLTKKGLLSLAEKYFECSGQLAKDCYKRELEAVFRSRTLAGFQILDIQDFSGQGTALVGMLDAFMDNKGIISCDQWRQFCNDIVILARFNKFVYTSEEEFSAHLEIVNYSNLNLNGEILQIRFFDDENNVLYSNDYLICQNKDDNYIDVDDLFLKFPYVEEIKNVHFELNIKKIDINNSYNLELIPEINVLNYKNDYIFTNLCSKADEYLKNGKTILIVPDLDELKDSIKGYYCQDFWCYPMFANISRMMEKPEPVGTMGLLVDFNHPILKKFPCKEYSTPIWWDIVENSRAEILDSFENEFTNIIRLIDNFERNHNLSILYEYRKSNGRVIVCNCNFSKLSLTPSGRLFINSIVSYIQNSNI